MMSMSYLFLFFITIFYIIYFLNNPESLQYTTTESFNVFIKLIIPSIIPMYIVSNMLLNNKFTIKLTSHISYFFKTLESNYSISLFLSSILIGNPSGIINIINAYKNKLISYEDTKVLLKSTCFVNPLFIISFCKYYQIYNYSLFLITSNIIANYLILIFHKKKQKNNSFKIPSINILSIITNSASITLNIFSIYYFINILKTPTNNLRLPIILSILLDFLELSSGTSKIMSYNLKIYTKTLLITILVSLTGLCILLQSINEIKKAPNNQCLLKSFIIGRFYQMTIVIILFIIFIQ